MSQKMRALQNIVSDSDDAGVSPTKRQKPLPMDSDMESDRETGWRRLYRCASYDY